MSPRRYSTGFGTSAEAQHPWPDDCGLQGGDDGIVLQKGSLEEALTDTTKGMEMIAAAAGAITPPHSYRTAFFEAFPRNPRSFLRGEGKTLKEAEDDCWAAWQKIVACTAHEFERGSYRTGAGICRHCGLFNSAAFDTTLDPCVLCGDSTASSSWGSDRNHRPHCKKCYPLIPEADKSELQKRFERMKASA